MPHQFLRDLASRAGRNFVEDELNVVHAPNNLRSSRRCRCRSRTHREMWFLWRSVITTHISAPQDRAHEANGGHGGGHRSFSAAVWLEASIEHGQPVRVVGASPPHQLPDLRL